MSSSQLIDFMITTHPAYPKLKVLAEERKTNIHQGERRISEHLHMLSNFGYRSVT